MALLLLLSGEMKSVSYQISASTILISIRENNLKRWEHLYEKYGPVKYSIISTLTSDKNLEEEDSLKLLNTLKNRKSK